MYLRCKEIVRLLHLWRLLWPTRFQDAPSFSFCFVFIQRLHWPVTSANPRKLLDRGCIFTNTFHHCAWFLYICVCLLLWSPFLISIKEECEGSGNPPDGIHFCLVLFRQQQGRERDPLQSESRRGTGTLLVERWRHTEKGKCWKGFSGSATVFIQVGWWDRRIWFEVSAPKNCSVTKGEIPFIWPHVLRNLNGFDFESLHSLHLWSLLRNLLWSTRSREISARISCGLWCWIFLFI